MNSKDYINLILDTKLALFSNIKGFYILRSYGYKLWENIKNILNKNLIKNKHKNVYFPLLMPKKLLINYYNHNKNFFNECAIITHTKFIKKNNKIIIDPNSKLNEELIIRPTSEIIIWHTYSKLIQSYKDLPILINQWSNVVRLELKNKMFIRNSEILWQEGHTAHINKKKAINEIKLIKKIYKNLIRKYLSIPYIFGKKTKLEKFTGSKYTYSFETLTKNGKCIQLATIHFLAKNYSKIFNVKFTDKNNKRKFVWSTSWGLSIRLIGAVVMIHSDNRGLILPPKIAPIHIIIISIINNKKKFNLYKKKILNKINKIKKIFKKTNLNIKYDNDNKRKPGYKFFKYEKMGIPLRIIIGIHEINNNFIKITRRDNLKNYYIKFKKKKIKKKIFFLLKSIQKNIYKKAKKNIKKKIFKTTNYIKFKKLIKSGGFIITYCYNKIIELKIKNETNATIRCRYKNNNSKGKCIYSGKLTNRKVIFGKSY